MTDDVIERGEEREVEAMTMRVMLPEDLLVTKLMAMTEHTLNYRSCLEIARALREQIDWHDVRRRTAPSPYGRAFFVIAEGLGIVEPEGWIRRRLGGRRPRGASTAARALQTRSGGPARG